MIDREALRKQLKEREAARQSGNIRFIGGDKTVNLRVLEFVAPEDESTQFSRLISEYIGSDNKVAALDRAKTFGAPCAATALFEADRDSSPFKRRRVAYLVNAIDVDKTPHKVETWRIPNTVWESIATMLVTDDWADVLTNDKGHYFTIARTGTDLNTEYSVTVSRNPWPVKPDLVKQVKDPLSAITDPGLRAQCETLGVDIDQLFPDHGSMDLVEPIATGSAPAEQPKAASGKAKPGVPAPKAKAAAKTPEPEPDPEPEAGELTLEVGCRVSADFDKKRGVVEGVVVALSENGKSADVSFDFDTANDYELPVGKLTVIEAAPAPDAETPEEAESTPPEEPDLPIPTPKAKTPAPPPKAAAAKPAAAKPTPASAKAVAAALAARKKK